MIREDLRCSSERPHEGRSTIIYVGSEAARLSFPLGAVMVFISIQAAIEGFNGPADSISLVEFYCTFSSDDDSSYSACLQSERIHIHSLATGAYLLSLSMFQIVLADWLRVLHLIAQWQQRLVKCLLFLQSSQASSQVMVMYVFVLVNMRDARTISFTKSLNFLLAIKQLQGVGR